MRLSFFPMEYLFASMKQTICRHISKNSELLIHAFDNRGRVHLVHSLGHIIPVDD